MATAMVQMNTRIGAQEKSAGDKALREAGFTPSAAIRALWNKAACGGEDWQKIVALLNDASTPIRSGDPAASSGSGAGSKSLSVETASLTHGRKLVPAFFADLEIAPEASPENAADARQTASITPFDKEIEVALVERYKERGLL